MTSSFANRYERAFRSFLSDRTERSLRTAYELGREAVQAELSVLDLAAAHHAALAHVLAAPPGPDAVAAMDAIDAAGDFLVESLAAFEMVQRGATETRRAAFEERRQTRMLRQLSTVLTDASLAATDRGSMVEVAQIVAEHTLELTQAAHAAVVVRAGAVGARADIAAKAESDGGDTWSEVFGPIDDRVMSVGGGRPETTRADLVALGGGVIGYIELQATEGAAFTQEDRAVLTQVAQMTAAAVERVQLHRG